MCTYLARRLSQINTAGAEAFCHIVIIFLRLCSLQYEGLRLSMLYTGELPSDSCDYVVNKIENDD
jgi:hypothetical protein